MKKFISEFKAFIMRGNVLDMAIGVIIATAFGKITTSLVNDLFINAPQKYRDIDGALYTIVGDGGMDFTLGDLTITSWEENGNTVTYHTKQEKFDDEGKFKEFIDGGDFTVERTDSGFTVTQYRIVY